MIRIYPSEEGFDELYQLANDIATLTNPQLFFNYKDSSELELKIEVQQLKEKMGELIS